MGQPSTLHSPGFALRAAEICTLLALAIVPAIFSVHAPALRMFEPMKVAVVHPLSVAAVGGVLAYALLTPHGLWRRLAELRSGRLALLGTGAVILSFLLSNALSIAPRLSWWGDYQQRQGTLAELSYAGLALAIVIVVRRRSQFELLLTSCAIGSIIPAAYACWQAWMPDLLPWVQITRVSSTAGNPISLAGYLIMVWPLTLYRAAISARRAKTEGPVAVALNVLPYAALLGLQTLAIVFSQSRGPVVGWIVGVLCGSWFVRGSRSSPRGFARGTIAVAVALAVVGTAIFVQRRNTGSATIEVRTVLWRATTALMKDTPWRAMAGFGPDTLALSIQSHYPPGLEQIEQSGTGDVDSSPDLRIDRSHNALLDVLATRGVVGLLGELAMLAAIGWLLVSAAKSAADDAGTVERRLLVGALAAALAAHVVEIQFLAPVTSTRMLYWVFTAMLVVLAGTGSVADTSWRDPRGELRDDSPEDRYSLTAILALTLTCFVFDFYTSALQSLPSAAFLLAIAGGLGLAVSHAHLRLDLRSTTAPFHQAMAIASVSSALFLALSAVYVWRVDRFASTQAFPDGAVLHWAGRDPTSILWLGAALIVVWVAYHAGSATADEPDASSRRTALVGVVVLIFGVFAAMPSLVAVRAAAIGGLATSRELDSAWPDAADLYASAASLQPDDPEYVVAAGRAFWRVAHDPARGPALDSLRDAIHAFEEASRRSPLDAYYLRLAAVAHRELGQRMRVDNEEEFEIADRLFSESAAQMPQSARTWQGWGELALARGRPEAAVERLDRSIALNDGIRATYLRRAAARTRLRDVAGADADLATARSLTTHMLVPK